MPNKARLLQGYIEKYLSVLEKEKRSMDKTIKPYRWELKRIFEALAQAKMETNPRLIGEKEIEYLRKEVFKNSEGYNRYRLSILGAFLKWCGNDVVEKMRVGWPQDMRINANWLEPEDAMALKKIAEGLEKVILHLELDLCLRRVEVIRLRPCDLKADRMNVLGKGRQGGKWRTIPYHPETRQILGEYLMERKRIIAKAREKDPLANEPENLLIYEKTGRLHAYQKGAIDNRLIALKERAESLYQMPFDFSNHTLRRTGGRMMWKAGIP